MQAIQTKYFGPTNTKGSRIKATADAGSIFVPYDHALNVEGNHEAAARAFAVGRGWLDMYNEDARMEGGSLPDGTYAWVFVHQKSTATGDWRDTAIDALIEGKAQHALNIICEQVGEQRVSPEQAWALCGIWDIEPGKMITLNGVDALQIIGFANVGAIRSDTGRRIMPSDIDDIARDLVKFLQSSSRY